MGTNRPQDVLRKIADATNFQKMKEGKSSTDPSNIVYRKGKMIEIRFVDSILIIDTMC